MLTTIVAVLGTLLGSIVTGTLQNKAADRTERTAAATRLLRDQLDTIAQLTAAASDYRRAMRKRAQGQLTKLSRTQQDQLRSESHAARGAITQPMTMLRILVPHPQLHDAAQTMVESAYLIRKAADLNEVKEAQDVARAAQDTFVKLAAELFADSALTKVHT